MRGRGTPQPPLARPPGLSVPPPGLRWPPPARTKAPRPAWAAGGPGRAGPGAAPGRSGSADRGRLPAAGKEARGGARAGVRHGYLHHHVVGQLRGAEELQDAPVGRHLLGALGVAVGEEVAVVALLRLAQRQALHLTPRFRAAQRCRRPASSGGGEEEGGTRGAASRPARPVGEAEGGRRRRAPQPTAARER